MLDLIEMYVQCGKVPYIPCSECEHSKLCSMAWIHETWDIENYFYSIHYAEGEV